jgi:Flp pilus assembly protein TadD
MSREATSCLLFFGLAFAGGSYAQTAQSWMDEGLRHLEFARYESAIEAFHHALDLDSTLALAQYDLGVCYFALGRFEEARAAFDQSRRLNPADRFTSYYLARLDLLEDRLDDAIRAFESLARPRPIADELYYLGSAWFRKGDFESAARNLRDAAANNASDYRVPFLLARALRKLGRETEAREQFARSSRLRDDTRATAQDILDCQSALNRLPREAAIDNCRKGLYGTDPVKLVNLGVALGEHGLYPEAVDPLAKAARLSPEDYEPHFNLGLTYFRLKQYANARAPLETAVSLRPEAFDAVAVLGSALFALGDDYAAVAQLRHAHSLRPADTKVTALLSQELMIISRHLRAQQDYNKAEDLQNEAAQLQGGTRP